MIILIFSVFLTHFSAATPETYVGNTTVSPETSVGNTTADIAALFFFKSTAAAAAAAWNATDSNPCLWPGVTCREGRVVSLSLPKKNLSGDLPPSLSSLSFLRHLNLRDNVLHGELPAAIFIHAPSLLSVVLAGNSFSGYIPAALYLCRRLRLLDLSRNNLTGPLPPGLGSALTHLEKLDLSSNQLTGPLPVDLGTLTNLQGTTSFSHNLFSGPVPQSLGILPENVYIDLSFNNLTGSIPQTGALLNRGPTAFAGNPFLCGPPLKNPCPPPQSPPPAVDIWRNGGGERRMAAAAIIGGDIVGVVIVGLLLSCCYRKCVESGRRRRTEEGGGGRRRELEVVGGGEEGMELEELLKGAAYVVGKEGVGIVYRVVVGEGVEVAVRRLGGEEGEKREEFRAEARAVGKVRHPNIVRLRAFYWSVDEKLLVHDFVSNGTLSAALHADKGPGLFAFTPIPWSARLKIMIGVARGMDLLHRFNHRKYIHGDLNPNNILLRANMDPCISDFGLTRLAELAGVNPNPHHNHFSSTATLYRAPEAAKKPSQKSDVYSYGMILLEMITGRWPLVHVGDSEVDLVRWINLCVDEKKPAGDVLDPYLAEDAEKEEEMVAVLKIAMACVQKLPERRPGMNHVLELLTKICNNQHPMG